MVVVNVSLPDSLVESLTEGEAGLQLPRYVLEATVLAALRDGRISTGRAREILGQGFHEGQEWLREKGATFEMSEDEIRAEIESATASGQAAA